VCCTNTLLTYLPYSVGGSSDAVLQQQGGSVAEWLACWTQAQKGLVQIAAMTLSGNSLRQTVHTHCASVHQAAKLVAALFSGGQTGEWALVQEEQMGPLLTR